MKPQIELEIEKQKKDILKYSSFLILGLEGITTVITKEISPLIPLLAAPVIVDILAIKNILNEKKRNKISLMFYKPFFKKNLIKWTQNYLNDSENLTEKKYKLIFLNLWANHKEIPLDIIFDKKIISDLSNELIQKKETAYSLEDMFYMNFSLVMRAQNKEIIPKTFLDEDNNNLNKKKIAKKIYKEFEDIGMAAKAFITGKEISFLLDMQDYRFNENDFVFINEYIKDNPTKDIYSINYLNPYLNDTINTLNKVISNEDNINNLNTLKNYCENMKEKDHDSMMEQVQELEKSLNVKFEYVNMKKELSKGLSIGRKNINKI